jgi:hypothetical protein
MFVHGVPRFPITRAVSLAQSSSQINEQQGKTPGRKIGIFLSARLENAYHGLCKVPET